MGGCFLYKKWKTGFFCKKWTTFPQRTVHYVQYQYFSFILHFTFFWGGVRTHPHPTHPPPAYGCWETSKHAKNKHDGGVKWKRDLVRCAIDVRLAQRGRFTWRNRRADSCWKSAASSPRREEKSSSRCAVASTRCGLWLVASCVYMTTVTAWIRQHKNTLLTSYFTHSMNVGILLIFPRQI